jgi:hypothetical protein
MNMRNIIVCCVILLIFGLSLALGPIIEKSENLVRRLQKLEQAVEKSGNYLGNSLAVYQANRGDAVFDIASRSGGLFSEGNWSLFGGQGVKGSWRKNHFKRARAITDFDDKILVGINGPNEGDAAIWAFSDGGWEKWGGAGINGSWRDSEEVVSIVVYREQVFVGLISTKHGATVWKFGEGGWKMVGGDPQMGWDRKMYPAALSMTTFRDRLVVALSVAGLKGWQNKPPSIHAFDGKHWEKIAGPDTWSKAYGGIYELFSDSGDSLYAAMGGREAQGDVWRYDGTTWEKIGGDGIRGSWINPGITWVLRFQRFQGRLIAVFNRDPMVNGNFSTIWAFDDEQWQPVGASCIPSEWRRLNNFNAVTVFKGRLLVGAGSYPSGQASIYELADGQCWRLAAGFGHNGSWGNSKGTQPLTYRSAREYIYKMVRIGEDILVGFGASKGAGQVWRYSENSN